MQALQGIAVSPGVAIGEALVVGNDGIRIPRRFVAPEAVEDEVRCLERAIAAVATEIEHNGCTISEQLGKQYGAIFAAHLQMLRDKRLYDEVVSLIRQQQYTAEYAISETLRGYAKIFQELDGTYLAERAQDFFDLEKHLVRSLLGQHRGELGQLSSPVIVVAHNLTPSETASLDRRHVLGFATEVGGAGGHTAIVAKGLELPAVVGVGRLLTEVTAGQVLIVDGDQGRVILSPDEDTLARYRRDVEQHRSLSSRLESLRDLPAMTLDELPIHLAANIEFPHEVQACIDRGADGIGLYRTEFLYLGRATEPSEEDHFRAYAEVVQAMGDRPVVIRTLDLGADKMGTMPRAEEEPNPFLGLRSIRLSLRNLPLFRIQLRAILRASTLGNVQVMFPLITTLGELLQAKALLCEAAEELEREGLAVRRDLPVGMMVEVPATVMMLDKFLAEVDFISIGTNDLAQYTLAVDRSNKEVADLYHASEPAVLRLIQMTLDAAQRAGVPANLCGQMSSSPAYVLMLLGMGLRSMSVPPGLIPEIKKTCRSVTIEQCQAIAAHVMQLDYAADIDAYLNEELKKIVPELVLH